MNCLLDTLNSLRASLDGFVSTPGEPAYLKATSLDNGRIVRSPLAVVHASSTQDIVETIRYAKNCSLQLTVKAGGHSYAGYCLNDGGIVLDLSGLNHITLGATTNSIVVEMGCTWEDVYKYLESFASHLVAIGGTCLSVGVAGFLLGGGYSFLSRSYGLGADNVISLTIVTAEGEVLIVSPQASTEEERNLFWACLGGGGGNFGIVISATLMLHVLSPSRILGGELIYPIERLDTVMAFYNEWVKMVPNSLAVYGYIGDLLTTVEKKHVTRRLRFQPVFNGDFREGVKLLEPLLALEPLEVRFFNVSFFEYLRICDHYTSAARRRSYTRSGFLPSGGLTPEVISLFRRYMDEAPSRESFMLWMHQGGQSNSFSSDALAFPHRDISFVFEVVALWREESDTRRNVEWAYEFGESLRPYFLGAFVNYIDPLLSGWTKMYYGQNYAKLLSLKKNGIQVIFLNFNNL